MFQLFKTCLPAGRKNKKEPEDLREVLNYLKKLEKDCQNLSQELRGFKEESKKSLRKVGIVRFNPFPEIGGDQSFSVAMLDENKDGFVLTSHYYGREANRTFIKPIKNGSSLHSLSPEEEKAINNAING